VKTFCRIGLLVLTALLTGCGGGSPAPSGNPAPTGAPLAETVGRDVMRAGDKITIRLTGVPEGEYIIEVQIPESGGISVPLLTQTFPAAGITAADLAAQITDAYKTQKIYTTPVVEVIPEERYVNVNGDVRNPARVVYTADMTLLTAIISCGGFDEYADRRHVRITRGQQTIIINANTLNSTPGADPPLYPGDVIYVPRTAF
jgi:protein involved in polysaccharide export with SLBB domain